MYKALTAVAVTLLAIGSAQAQRRIESLLDNGQAASRGNMNAKPYDQNGVAKPYDQNSVTKPYDQNSVANPYSPDSINNPYRAGSQHRQDSPSHFGFRWAPDDE
jgi:hypothetical protein